MRIPQPTGQGVSFGVSWPFCAQLQVKNGTFVILSTNAY